MKLSANFDRDEFACGCNCGYDTVDAELLELLEIIRGYFHAPVTVTSGARCPAWNQKVGGSPQSQHLLGKAADIVVASYTPQQVATFLQAHMPHRGGLGIYDDFIHIDVRDGKSRW